MNARKKPRATSRFRAAPASIGKKLKSSTPPPLTHSQFLSGAVAPRKQFTFLSLFSGAGVGDYGLQLAGGQCLGACEIDLHRRAVHQANITGPIWGDLRKDSRAIAKKLKGQELDLLLATPPCQGFSTANSKRGKHDDHEHTSRDDRNGLFFEALKIAHELKPRVVAFENVPNFFKRKIKSATRPTVIGRVIEFIDSAMPGYTRWAGVVCFSELGVPQRRKRALALYVRADVAAAIKRNTDTLNISPDYWPGKLHRSPRTIADALRVSKLKRKASEKTNDTLHSAPSYSPMHQRWISSIPAGSGRSAWQNACEHCGSDSTDVGVVICVQCSKPIRNRPHVETNKGIRPIRGFKTSYKRMAPNELAPTVTTASGHFSSDLKLHPFENRVLTPHECAKLQTIPETFVWPQPQRFRSGYLVREMIGEAVPTLVTYRLGLATAAWVSLLRA